MRLRRAGPVAALVAASLVVPSVAAADPTASVAPTGKLGPEGASATVLVTGSCDPIATSVSIAVQLAQSTGKRLVLANGSAPGPHPIVCDGTPQVVPVTVFVTTAPLKAGRTAVTATVFEFNPFPFLSFGAVAGPLEVVLKKK